MSILPETWSETPDTPSELAEFYADHPATLEQEEVDRSPLTIGFRPQWANLLVTPPTRPLRAPSHNARVAGFLASRLSQQAGQGRPVTVADPRRMSFRALLGARHIAYGFALNMSYVYYSPRGCSYVITGYATGYTDGRLTGAGYARDCTCPDFEKRRGPARDQIHGEERCCKHMRLFLAMVYLWQGQMPWIGGIPAQHQIKGAAFVLREF